MKYFISAFILLLLFSNASIGQNNPVESIEFPTISNNENIDLNDTARCSNGEHLDRAAKDKSRRRLAQEIAKSNNFGFYTDIIIGGIVLIIGFIGWKIYLRFAPEDEDIADNE